LNIQVNIARVPVIILKAMELQMKLSPLLFSAIATVAVAQQEPIPTTVAKEVAAIVDAKPIERVPPKFPITEAKNGIDGWVKVSFIVEPDGSTSNAIIENSSGRKSFEKEALRAIKKWQYEPAMEDGKPIQQCHNSVRLDFSMARRQEGVSKKFLRLYNNFNEALKKKDEALLETLAEQLKTYNIKALRESYYQYTLLAEYAKFKKKDIQALGYLNKAYSFSGASQYLNYKKKHDSVSSIGVKVEAGKSAEESISAYQRQLYKHLDEVLYPLLHSLSFLTLIIYLHQRVQDCKTCPVLLF